MTNTIYAHSNGGDQNQWQLLSEHLKNVEQQAAKFAADFDCADWAAAAGILHDLGKILTGFQNKLHKANGLAYEFDEASGASNHSGAGAAFAEERYKILGRVLAYIVAGHHAGLPDYQNDQTGNAALLIRMKEARENLDEIRGKIDQYVLSLPELKMPPFVKPENFHLWVRMLFSCLIDADWLDTEKACDPDKSQIRTEIKFPPLEELKKLFDKKIEEKVSGSKKNKLNIIRAAILGQCREVGKSSKGGLFTLAVPTGGGKTLSSMAFALEHAIKHKKSRVIYVIPYTSIIEQTANVFRDIFGTKNVVEHHSNIDTDKFEKDSEIPARMELAAENWDAPIIVTTNVQFFESLYSAKPRRCRKLHNIANSVVILDEAQLITPEFLTPCVDVLNQLTSNFRTSIVLCTATQPNLPKLKPTDIIPPERQREYYRKLKRVEYQFPNNLNEKTSFEQLAQDLLSHEKVLCIVNTRSDCRKLYELVCKKAPKGTVHLSALMCGEHRSKVIAEIKEQLKNKEESLRVISTQLVEAGVDIDFPVVYRALAGLDSIIQAAGRCNREGDDPDGYGQAHIFVPEKPAPKGLLRKGADTTQELWSANLIDPENPDTFHFYFDNFYDRVNDTGKDILKELKCNGCGDDVYFRSVGEKFHLINDDYTLPIIARYKNSELIEQLKVDGPKKALMQRLQRYTVNVPQGHVNKLLRCGLIQRLMIFGKESDFLVQYSENGYSEEFGVDMEKLELSAAEQVT